MIIKPGLHLADEFAEAEHHAELVRLDAEEAGETPQGDGRQRDQRETATAEIAGQQAAQPVLAGAQKFFEVGRSPRSRPPRAPGLVTPRHDLAPRRRRTLPGPFGAALVAGGYRVSATPLTTRCSVLIWFGRLIPYGNDDAWIGSVGGLLSYRRDHSFRFYDGC